MSLGVFGISYSIFLSIYSVENVAMLHVLSIYYVVAQVCHVFFQQLVTWEVIGGIGLEPDGMVDTFMRTGASNMIFVVLVEMTGFIVLDFLPQGILRMLGFMNAIAIWMTFFFVVTYLVTALLVNHILWGDRAFLCCKCTKKAGFFDKRPLHRFFSLSFWSLLVKENMANTMFMISLIVSCLCIGLCFAFDFTKLNAAEVRGRFVSYI